MSMSGPSLCEILHASPRNHFVSHKNKSHGGCDHHLQPTSHANKEARKRQEMHDQAHCRRKQKKVMHLFCCWVTQAVIGEESGMGRVVGRCKSQEHWLWNMLCAVAQHLVSVSESSMVHVH
eukprot:1158542-Pelagomonas_calceolata.AAC.4